MRRLSLLDQAQTYSEDLALFSQLGFTPFTINDQAQHLLGDYKLPDHTKATVKVSVLCMPAQFWYFDIITESGQHLLVETGSGSLTTYWTTILLVAQERLQITKGSKPRLSKVPVVKDYATALKKWEASFYCHECGEDDKQDFTYDRRVANGEVWKCRVCHTETLVDDMPKEEDY